MDQLIKRRGKAGLIAVIKTFDEAKQWIMERMCKTHTGDTIDGQLTHLLVEPLVPHSQDEKYYVCIWSHQYEDEILFYHEGGVDVGDADEKAERLRVKTGASTLGDQIKQQVRENVTGGKQENLASLVVALFKLYQDLLWVYFDTNSFPEGVGTEADATEDVAHRNEELATTAGFAMDLAKEETVKAEAQGSYEAVKN